MIHHSPAMSAEALLSGFSVDWSPPSPSPSAAAGGMGRNTVEKRARLQTKGNRRRTRSTNPSVTRMG